MPAAAPMTGLVPPAPHAPMPASVRRCRPQPYRHARRLPPAPTAAPAAFALAAMLVPLAELATPVPPASMAPEWRPASRPAARKPAPAPARAAAPASADAASAHDAECRGVS